MEKTIRQREIRKDNKTAQAIVRALIYIILTALTACNDDHEDVNELNKQTILIFMPWAGDLYSFFTENLDSIESAIVANQGLKNSRVMLFLSGSAQGSELSEIVYNANTRKCERNLVKSYTGADYTTVEGITDILNEVKNHAKALNYAMIIGCHGSGWTYKDAWQYYPYRSPRRNQANSLRAQDNGTSPEGIA